MSATNFERNLLLDHIFGAQTYTPPATWYFALFTVAPTVSTGGTEVTGSSYARVAKTNNLTNFPAAVGGAKSNGTPVTFPASTGAQGTATHFGLFDASTGGNLRHFAPLTTSKVIGNGDVAEFGVGQLTWLQT